MSFAIQTAVYNALIADVTLMAMIQGVYDNPPSNADDTTPDSAFPYLTIGEAISSDFSTDDNSGQETLFSVHVWSRQSGARKEAKQIIEQVFQVLNRNRLTISGFTTLDIQYSSDQTTLDPDGVTVHGVIEFRALLFRA